MKNYSLMLDLADLYEVAHEDDLPLLEFVEKEMVPALYEGFLQDKLGQLIDRVKNVVKQAGGDELNALREMLKTTLKNYANRSHDQQGATELGNAALRKGRQAMLATTAIIMMANALFAQHPAQAQKLAQSALEKMNANSVMTHVANHEGRKAPDRVPDTTQTPPPKEENVGDGKVLPSSDEEYPELTGGPDDAEAAVNSLRKQLNKKPAGMKESIGPRAGYGLTPCPGCQKVFCPGCEGDCQCHKDDELPTEVGPGTPPVNITPIETFGKLVSENCSAGAVGAGAVAATAMPLGAGVVKRPKIKYRTQEPSKVQAGVVEGEVVPMHTMGGKPPKRPPVPVGGASVHELYPKLKLSDMFRVTIGYRVFGREKGFDTDRQGIIENTELDLFHILSAAEYYGIIPRRGSEVDWWLSKPNQDGRSWMMAIRLPDGSPLNPKQLEEMNRLLADPKGAMHRMEEASEPKMRDFAEPLQEVVDDGELTLADLDGTAQPSTSLRPEDRGYEQVGADIKKYRLT